MNYIAYMDFLDTLNMINSLLIFKKTIRLPTIHGLWEHLKEWSFRLFQASILSFLIIDFFIIKNLTNI